MKYVCFFLVMLSVAACSSLKISSDYDSQNDFTRYKTYKFTQESLNLGINSLNRDRLLRAIETELAAKGFSKAENPDVLIDLHVKAEQKVDATATTTPSYGYGGPWRYGYGGGFSTTQINYNEYIEGTLFVNMVDAASEKMVWQGRATNTIDEDATPEKREKNINYAVKQVFTKYPPKAK